MHAYTVDHVLDEERLLDDLWSPIALVDHDIEKVVVGVGVSIEANERVVKVASCRETVWPTPNPLESDSHSVVRIERSKIHKCSQLFIGV